VGVGWLVVAGVAGATKGVVGGLTAGIAGGVPPTTGGEAGLCLTAGFSAPGVICAAAGALVATKAAHTAAWNRRGFLGRTMPSILAQRAGIYSVFSSRFFIRLRRASKDSLVMILLNSAR
jgi:hypothetical protein